MSNLVGQHNDGWAVASRVLFHERNMVGDSGLNDSRYTPAGEERDDPLVALVQRLGVAADPEVRQLLGEALTLAHLKRPAVEHISEGLRSGRFPGPGASLLKLLSSHIGYRRLEIGMQIAGNSGIVWDGVDEESPGIQWLGARAHTLAGGTTEMQLNQISERVLGLPRDPSTDRELPFSQLPHN